MMFQKDKTSGNSCCLLPGFELVCCFVQKVQEYALKVQPLECMPRTSRRDGGKRVDDITLVHIERTVLATCKSCQFIVNLEYAFHTDSYAVLALEYVPGECLLFYFSNNI